MVSSTIAIVAITAIFTGILLVGENPRLPSYKEVKATYPTLAKGGYDLEELEAPRLTGIPLQMMAWMMRTPVLSRIISKLLYKENRMIQVRRLAAYLPDMPLYYPFVEPQQSIVPPSTPLNLTVFSQHAQQDYPTTSIPFHHATIQDYTSRYASHQLTPLQVAHAVLAALDHSQQREHPLNIMIERQNEAVFAQARASTARYAANTPLGVLDGVPVVVKDELLVQDHIMSTGTSFLGRDQSPATEDDVPIRRLRAEGAIIIGTTNMHEIGLGVTGYNEHYGLARNPYNPLHYTGGSSSGSAAAVAAGIVPLAVGIDGGGSIRIPAALCGVVGIKPTFQRVPPLSADCPTVAHIGPIAGSVRDAAIGYAVMSGGHASFPRGMSMPPVDLQSFEQTTNLKGLKVGYFPAFTNDSSPIIAQTVNTIAHQLQQLGAELVEIELHHLQAIHLAHSITISSEMAQNLDQYYSFIHEMSAEVQILLSMAREITPLDYLAAQRVRAFALRQLQTEVFSKVDVWIAPSTGITAPRVPTAAVTGGELNSQQIAKIFRFSLYGNFVGHPGVAVPIGYDKEGFPLSVQIQASHWNEDVMLRVAHTIERLYTTTQQQPSVYYSILEDAIKY